MLPDSSFLDLPPSLCSLPFSQLFPLGCHCRLSSFHSKEELKEEGEARMLDRMQWKEAPSPSFLIHEAKNNWVLILELLDLSL